MGTTLEDFDLSGYCREGIPTDPTCPFVLDGIVLQFEIDEHQRSSQGGLELVTLDEFCVRVKGR